MDALERDDRERARRATPEERAAWLLETMRAGVRLRRAALRARYPQAGDVEIEHMLEQWLARAK